MVAEVFVVGSHDQKNQNFFIDDCKIVKEVLRLSYRLNKR